MSFSYVAVSKSGWILISTMEKSKALVSSVDSKSYSPSLTLTSRGFKLFFLKKKRRKRRQFLNFKSRKIISDLLNFTRRRSEPRLKRVYPWLGRRRNIETCLFWGGPPSKATLSDRPAYHQLVCFDFSTLFRILSTLADFETSLTSPLLPSTKRFCPRFVFPYCPLKSIAITRKCIGKSN